MFWQVKTMVSAEHTQLCTLGGAAWSPGVVPGPDVTWGVHHVFHHPEITQLEFNPDSQKPGLPVVTLEQFPTW